MLRLEAGGRRIGQTWLWRNLSVDVRPGDALGVTGPSGSGKTLLLRSLALLDPLDEGRLVFEGAEPAAHDVPAYRAQVVYLHQQPAFFEGTVQQNLEAVFRLRCHRRRRYNADRVVESLAGMNKQADFLSRPVSALSGGEAQLVAFLRALQVEPRILLLDEPTAALDPESTAHIETLVAKWRQADTGRAVVWVSHAPGQQDRVTNRRLSLAAHAEGGR